MKNTKYFDLQTILPHRPPMIFIDEVIEYDLDQFSLTASVMIKDDSMFFDKNLGGVPAWAGLEYIAQTVGALSGICNRENGNHEPQLGFILGARKYKNTVKYYKNKEKYYIFIEKQFYDSELGNFAGTIKDEGGNLCAAVEITVFTPKQTPGQT